MSGLGPEGEELRSALAWLAERRREEPAAPRAKLVEEAALRFDLSPVQVDFLLERWRE